MNILPFDNIRSKKQRPIRIILSSPKAFTVFLRDNAGPSYKIFLECLYRTSKLLFAVKEIQSPIH